MAKMPRVPTAGVWAVLVIAGLAFAPAAQSQVLYGSITGHVTDTTGAVAPAVKVLAQNVATNVAKSGTTDQRGAYLFSDL
ncbi:MAG TPA: carboxypeptidase-like regulatory domain-containing protein, partial [Vicinamibacteria bacterium]